MVGKLIKHDIIDSRKAHLPVFGMILAGTILAISSLYMAKDPNNWLSFISSLVNFLIFGLIVAIMVMSFKASIYVLYTSIYKENAYRLFTLPVKTWQILLSKIVTALVWSFLVGLATLISVALIGGIAAEDIFIIFRGIGEVIPQIFNYITPSLIFAFVTDMGLKMLVSTMIILFAGSVGNSSLISKNRGIITFVIVLLTSSVYGRISALFGADFASVVSRYNLSAVISGSIRINFTEFMWVFAFDAIVIAFLVIGTLWFWNNKLEIN